MSARAMMFALITLAPVPLLAAGAFWGGAWLVAGLIYLTGFTLVLDELTAFASDPVSPEAEFPAATGLSVTLALAHFPLMLLAVHALAGATGLAGWERLLVLLAFGLFFGQVSNSNAHELIHRSTRFLRGLGHWVFISHQFGHHASAHPKVHHRYVGSDDDPSSATLGQSFYRFAPRAWMGSFRSGFRVETRLWRSTGARWWRHAYASHIIGGLLCLGVAYLAGEFTGLAGYLVLASYATVQLLLSDYVQHYGLRRQVQADGRLEPVGPQHSWNAPHWFSNFLMLAAPRHSDHHAHPSKLFPALELPGPDQVPTLPRSLPVMGFVALMPARWQRLMDPLVTRWSPGPVTPD